MHKKFILFIRILYYISFLTFFNKEYIIILSILLASILVMEKWYYPLLILPLVLIIPLEYSIILIILIIPIIVLHRITTKYKYTNLLLLFFLLAIFNIYLAINKDFSYFVLSISIIQILILSIINFFYIYHKDNDNYYLISKNDDLINLIILFYYMLLSITLKTDNIAIFYTFIQLFLINNYIYNIVFFLLGISYYKILFKSLNFDFLYYLSGSFCPFTMFFKIDYHSYSVIFFTIDIILIILSLFKNKDISVENNYINNIFSSYKNFLNLLNNENKELEALKKLKQTKIEEIEKTFCNKCRLDRICVKRRDLRYQFLSYSICNNDYNKYNCPYYNSFFLNKNIALIKNNDVTENYLIDELDLVYNQGLKQAHFHNKALDSIRYYGYNPIKLFINSRLDTFYITLYLDKNKKVVKELFLKIYNKIFKQDFELKELTNNDYNIVHIYKRTKLRVMYHAKILSKDTNLVSGDNYYIKRDYNDSYIFCLSDGMGSGHNAYVESMKILKIVKELLEYNLSIPTTLKMIEEIYNNKIDYDSYATLDLLYLNTASKVINLYKMGSTTTYLYHNKSLISYENKSLPLKLDDINSTYQIEIYENDIILLISDGVSDFISKEDIENILENNEIPDIIVSLILEKIKKDNPKLKDDASIIAIKVY